MFQINRMLPGRQVNLPVQLVDRIVMNPVFIQSFRIGCGVEELEHASALFGKTDPRGIVVDDLGLLGGKQLLGLRQTVHACVIQQQLTSKDCRVCGIVIWIRTKLHFLHANIVKQTALATICTCIAQLNCRIPVGSTRNTECMSGPFGLAALSDYTNNFTIPQDFNSQIIA